MQNQPARRKQRVSESSSFFFFLFLLLFLSAGRFSRSAVEQECDLTFWVSVNLVARRENCIYSSFSIPVLHTTCGVNCLLASPFFFSFGFGAVDGEGRGWALGREGASRRHRD